MPLLPLVPQPLTIECFDMLSGQGSFEAAHRNHRRRAVARGDGGQCQRAQRAVRLDAVLRDPVASIFWWAH